MRDVQVCHWIDTDLAQDGSPFADIQYGYCNQPPSQIKLATPPRVSGCTQCWGRNCVNNIETSYFTQLKICHLMTTFRCPSEISITSWLFRARWSTWPGNHLVPCAAELVGSCIPIHAHRCLPDPKCLFYPSGLSLCLSVDHCCLVPVDDMVLFHGMVCDGWLVSYTALPYPGGSGLCTSCENHTWDQVISKSRARAVNNQEVIKMSDGHQNVIIR